jgi:hypothetical protein
VVLRWVEIPLSGPVFFNDTATTEIYTLESESIDHFGGNFIILGSEDEAVLF